MAQLFDTMSDVRKGKFEKQLVSSASIDENAKGWVHSNTLRRIADRDGVNRSAERPWGCDRVGGY